MILIPIHLEFVFESNQSDVEQARKDASHYVMQFLERCPSPHVFGLKFKEMRVEDPARIVRPDADACEKTGGLL